ncbi:MAG: hypothetical protein SPJ78_04030 [Corynebacterium camporealensis]|uniref:Yip1 family protein n=1 Tax=Corynebacterium camporealensis TaxID=161896 RepID=UPI002A91758D|nr:hypothetical protein [Corynebacterium camporealensis]MDY5839876.1 hypothetical protein [Corynebacterium camporealensis]
MANEKQLTVAELLARQQKERGDKPATSRRRRRRSLEDGGISVSELTGNLSKVKASPAESKHSNVSIDETAPVIPAPDRAESKDSTQQPESAQPKDSEKKKDSAPAKDAPKKADFKKTESKDFAKKPDAQQKNPFAKEAPADKKPEKQDKNPVASVKEASAKDEPKAAEAKKPESAKADSAKTESAKTDSVKKADKPAEKPEEKPTAENQPSSDDTAEIQKVTDEPKQKQQADTKTKTAGAAAGVAGAGVVGASASKADDTGELPVVRDEQAQQPAAEHDEKEEEEAKLKPFSVILLALIGIVLGAVIFMGFQVLWDRFALGIVGLLAIGVTAAMVGIVHALRTDRDGLSMGLAGIVGLVLTFGPLLLV